MKRILFALAVVYLVTHLIGLLQLPIFADEAIYIRWSQLIVDDWQRYLFFSMNDGKTPLWIWLMVAGQLLKIDQLLSARLTAVLVGLLQVISMFWLGKVVTQDNRVGLLSAILTLALPFWFLHHRLALIDGLLVVLLTLSLGAIYKLTKDDQPVWILSVCGLFGLALLTKIPAVLFLPAFSTLLLAASDRKDLVKNSIKLGVSVGIGVTIFALLRLHPAFGQLFSRGSDFLYPWSEVVLQGAWKETTINLPTYVNYFLSYLTTPVLLLAVASLFSKQHQRVSHALFWGSILFCLPIALLGKVVYPRYFLPALIGFTLSAAIATVNYWDYLSHQKQLLIKGVGGLVLASLLGFSLGNAVTFAYYSVADVSKMPLVAADKQQFLTSWSSGHGIVETVELITTTSQESSVAVATEGYFGTLPDALNVYFHQRDTQNIAIEGIGVPVREIPDSFWQRAAQFDQVWLVVNSHRLAMELDHQWLLAEYCRPFEAPCLQVWDVTALRPRH